VGGCRGTRGRQLAAVGRAERGDALQAPPAAWGARLATPRAPRAPRAPRCCSTRARSWPAVQRSARGRRVCEVQWLKGQHLAHDACARCRVRVGVKWSP